jgi:hypothetical protein
MKRQVMIGLVILVIGVVIVALAMGVGRGKKGAVKVSPEVQKKQKVVAAAMVEAQRAYDKKDYKAAIEKTEAILKNVDNMSQEAKNLLQVSQLSQQGQMPGLNIPVPEPVVQAAAPVVSAPVTEVSAVEQP